eukprot:CAMPEP_0198124774 /NCGR_PEP_ID=MMETSP1442-20131203/40872_1 /TAXON_ID= /ORGANISM="Craspedostauros australis, Strain CCMP3328" /LENGTH=118 /DNA_ID=CAMNT_0043784247 /DNA_START=178 /DNA_END=534 /DNA_ORIENTATION=+
MCAGPERHHAVITEYAAFRRALRALAAMCADVQAVPRSLRPMIGDHQAGHEALLTAHGCIDHPRGSAIALRLRRHLVSGIRRQELESSLLNVLHLDGATPFVVEVEGSGHVGADGFIK